MSKDLQIKCAYCDKKEQFVDVRVAQNKNWKLIGWSIDKNAPITACPDCKEKYLNSVI